MKKNIKKIFIPTLFVMLQLIVITNEEHQENLLEPILEFPWFPSEQPNLEVSEKCNNAIGCYERALKDLEISEQQLTELQEKTAQKAAELQQKITELEQLMQRYDAELSKYTETQKAAFDQRLEKALNAQLIRLTMQYEEKIRQDYTRQMRQLIQKLQRINQAEVLFRFQDSFLGDVTKHTPSPRQHSPTMIIIPEGQYTMGYIESTEAMPFSLTQKTLDETEIEVTLKRFAISQHEITVSQYAAFLNDIQHQSHFNYRPTKRTISYQSHPMLSHVCEVKQRDNANCTAGIIYQPNTQTWQANTGKFDHPITLVSWYGARAYTNWLSQQTGFTYRLPTEAEWEYAARADRKTLYWWGNQIDTQQANFNPTMMIHKEEGHFVYRKKLLPVDNLSANLWGLYHVHGNASEWTCSPDLIDRSDIKNWQTCLLSGTRYIIRGGSWRNPPYQLRATHRRALQAATQEDDLTFRVVREL